MSRVHQLNQMWSGALERVDFLGLLECVGERSPGWKDSFWGKSLEWKKSFWKESFEWKEYFCGEPFERKK